MNFLKYMLFRIIGILFIIWGVVLLIYPIASGKNFGLLFLGFILLIASKYFLTYKDKKVELKK